VDCPTVGRVGAAIESYSFSLNESENVAESCIMGLILFLTNKIINKNSSENRSENRSEKRKKWNDMSDRPILSLCTKCMSITIIHQ
jgi:hypothetical protein